MDTNTGRHIPAETGIHFFEVGTDKNDLMLCFHRATVSAHWGSSLRGLFGRTLWRDFIAYTPLMGTRSRFDGLCLTCLQSYRQVRLGVGILHLTLLQGGQKGAFLPYKSGLRTIFLHYYPDKAGGGGVGG